MPLVEISKRKKIMSDKEIGQRKHVQSILSRTGGAIGITSLGALALSSPRGLALLNRAKRPIAEGSKIADSVASKAPRTAEHVKHVSETLGKQPITREHMKSVSHTANSIGAGLGGIGAFNFASYTSAEAKKKKAQAKPKELVKMDTYFDMPHSEGIAKRMDETLEEIEKKAGYDPEKNRERRSRIYQKGAEGSAVGLAGAGVYHKYKAVKPGITRGAKIADVHRAKGASGAEAFRAGVKGGAKHISRGGLGTLGRNKNWRGETVRTLKGTKLTHSGKAVALEAGALGAAGIAVAIKRKSEPGGSWT